MIVADRLGKDFREGFHTHSKTALGEISFEIQSGACVGFLGPNGAGKSTTIHIVMGFLRPSRGQVLVNGRSPQDPESRRSVGFLPEVFAFDRFASVNRLLGRADAMSGAPVEGRADRVRAALNAVDLADAAGRRIGALSKGLTQRVGLAQAILGDPELLVLDEPMSGMDPAGRRMVHDLLQARRDQRRTTFFSSHILSDVEELVDEVLILHRGELRAALTLADLSTGAGQSTIVFEDDQPERFDAWLAERGISRSPADGRPSGQLLTVANDALKTAILSHLAAEGANIIEVAKRHPSLEDMFLRLTGGDEKASS